MRKITKDLHKACEEAGLRLEACGEGHYKIHGRHVVNYWPESKKQTAHIVGQKPQYNVYPSDAVKMAGGPPPKEPVKEVERYTPRENLPKDPVLMRTARAIQEKHGLLHNTETP